MPIVASNPSPKTSHGPFADRPLATDSGVNGGDIYITTDVWPQRVFQVRLDETSTREWDELLTTESIISSQPTTVDIYVETTGSDSNSGLSPASPLLTLNQALLNAGRCTAKKVYIHVGAGIFDQPVNTDNSNGSVYVNIPTLAGGVGRTDCEPLIIQGTMADAGTGTRTQLANASGTAPTYTTITDTAGGLTVSAHKGQWIRYTSGAASGRCFLIKDNTATVITLVAFGATGAANGDTYVIEDCATQIRWLVGGSPAQNIFFVGGVMISDSIQWTFTGGGVNMNVNFESAGGAFVRSRFKAGDATTVFAFNFRSGLWNVGTPGLFSSETLFKPRGGASFAGGTDIVSTATSSITSACPLLNLGQVRVKSTNVFCVQSLLVSTFFLEASAAQVVATSQAVSASFNNGRIDGATGTTITMGGVTYRAILLARAGRMRVSATDISNTVNGDQVGSVGNAVVTIAGAFTGSNNVAGTQRPVMTGHGGIVQMDDPGGTQTCQGSVAGDDVVVGANAVTTYANIAAGAAANISDFAAVSPMYCVVRK